MTACYYDSAAVCKRGILSIPWLRSDALSLSSNKGQHLLHPMFPYFALHKGN